MRAGSSVESRERFREVCATVVELTFAFSQLRTMDNFIKIEKIGEGEWKIREPVVVVKLLLHALHHVIV